MPLRKRASIDHLSCQFGDSGLPFWKGSRYVRSWVQQCEKPNSFMRTMECILLSIDKPQIILATSNIP